MPESGLGAGPGAGPTTNLHSIIIKLAIKYPWYIYMHYFNTKCWFIKYSLYWPESGRLYEGIYSDGCHVSCVYQEVMSTTEISCWIRMAVYNCALPCNRDDPTTSQQALFRRLIMAIHETSPSSCWLMQLQFNSVNQT